MESPPATHRPSRRHREALEARCVPATWTPLTNLGGGGEMMLLTDGSVMAEGLDNGSVSKNWSRLTPSSTGSYAAGTWSATAPSNLQRLYFGSNVLPDGRMFVVGGEYSGPSGAQNITNTGEIYNPATNTWSGIPNFPLSSFGDDPTMLLSNGKILAGYIFDGRTYLYDPATNAWSQTGTKLRNDRSDEETFVLLPGGSVLTYEIFSGFTHAQKYNPTTGLWSDAGTVPVALTSSSPLGSELGPALLLPDGRVFQVGANNHTAIYTPGTNSWVQGPDTPSSGGVTFGAADAPGAILPNGHVLYAANNISTLNANTPFNPPTHLFDFDPVANTTTDITATLPAALQAQLTSEGSFVDRMLMLPNGHLLLSAGFSTRLWDLTPDGGPQAAWRPVIYGVTANGGASFHMTGTQLNGISQGASYGDDAEMDENYPIVSLRSLTGQVYYTKTTNWAPGVVQSGATVLGTDFQVPASVPSGTYYLTVSAAGIQSIPIFFHYTAPPVVAALADAVGGGGAAADGDKVQKDGIAAAPRVASTGGAATLPFAATDLTPATPPVNGGGAASPGNAPVAPKAGTVPPTDANDAVPAAAPARLGFQIEWTPRATDPAPGFLIEGFDGVPDLRAGFRVS